MMARYIDAECDAVTEVIGRRAFRNRSDIQDFLDNIPTADVVPVVRCCNCTHLKTNTSKKNYCDIHSTTWDKFYVRLDDYCSYGERE